MDGVAKATDNCSCQVLVESFEHALARFIVNAKACVNEYFATNFPRNNVPTLECSPGGVKFVRIVQRETNGGGSAYCFVEVATGNVLKAAGFKAPAKGVRGSIYSKDFAGYGVDHYGAKDLR